jgi:hypothetical protein
LGVDETGMDFKTHRTKCVKGIPRADVRVVGDTNSTGSKVIAVMVRTEDAGVFDPECRLSMSADEARSMIQQLRQALSNVGERA